MINRFLIIIMAVVVVAGCGRDETPGTVDVIKPPDEWVSKPDVPMGERVVGIDEQKEFLVRGAKNSRGHPLQYRFDFDAVGGHNFSQWIAPDTHGNALESVSYTESGEYTVKAQAWCAYHTSIESEWSEGLGIEAGLGPDTEIFHIVNMYTIGRTTFADTINFRDAIPDTVPYRSWITIFYKGEDTTLAASECPDPMNECLAYQVQYSRDSDRLPGAGATSQWVPYPPEDSNPYGTTDSTSMNIGSLEYTIRARAVDWFDRPDMVPPEIEIVGNFDPTLDGLVIRNENGDMVGDSQTLFWNFWEPADSELVIVGTDLKVRKMFFFVVDATGHDHPKERQDSGVFSWFYQFERESEPGIYDSLGRSGNWVDGIAVNSLKDTIRWVVEYPVSDVNGDEVFNNLPGWIDRWYDFSVMGRDIPRNESFDQYVFFYGEKQLANSYLTDLLGRWTAPGNQQIKFSIVR